MINEVAEVQRYLAGKNLKKDNLYHILLLIAKWYKEQGYPKLKIRESIFAWAKENGIHIKYNVNDLIGRALEDKRRLTDNVVVRVNQADIAEINRRFDSRKTKYVALAFLCYGKAYADRDREFSVSSAALGAWLDMSRSTLQTIYIPELVDYEYLSIIQKPQNTYSWGAKKSFHSTKYRLEVPIHNSGEFILTNNNIQKLSAEIFS